MFLVNYSSSSDSEDEKVEGTKPFASISLIKALSKTPTNKILLPEASSLLGKRKQKAIDDEVSDDPSQHDGRLRSFKHERGNWATYVYIPAKNTILEDLQDACHLHLQDKMNFKISQETHLSLTKTVVLQYHFIESFVETLEKGTQSLESFTVSFDNLKVYTNAEHTRTFLALTMSDLYFQKMLTILQKIDTVMKDFKLETFYEDPSFHISIMWCTGDCVSLVDPLIPTILESIKERLPFYLKIDKLCCKTGFKEFYFELK